MKLNAVDLCDSRVACPLSFQNKFTDLLFFLHFPSHFHFVVLIEQI